MEFDIAKENIQPLSVGRNVSILQAALNSESNEELQNQRKNFEKNIKEYEGDDPLEAWFEYIIWIEQSYPSGGKESGLDEVIRKCLVAFENDASYRQDRRFIKLYIKFIDSHENPQECYQELYNQGIGTMVADLYICWAYYYDLSGNFKKADNIFQLGLQAKAQPYDELELAHKQFGFQMSQRILHNDEISQQKFLYSMQERRQALTSLRSHKKKVGSLRTGSTAVKSLLPGKIHVNQQKPVASNTLIRVYDDENADPNAISEPSDHQVSIVRTLIDSARKQENTHEPGPWSKGHDKKKGKGLLTTTHELGFSILEDDSDFLPKINLKDDKKLFEKGIQIEDNFIKKNKPQSEWILPVTTENEAIANTFPKYEKFYMYPKPNLEFSIEEYEAYKWWKKHSIENDFTKKYDGIWANNVMINARLYPNFSKTNLKQPEFKTNIVQLDGDNHSLNLGFKIKEIYPEECEEEFQFEEVLYKKIKNNERKIKIDGNQTIAMEEQMEETMINDNNVRRKSFFPPKKSFVSLPILPKKSLVRLENLGELISEDLEESKANNIDEKVLSRRSVIIQNPLIPDEGLKKETQELITENLKICTEIHPIEETTEEPEEERVNSFQFMAPVPLKIGSSKGKIPFEIFQEDETKFEGNETCSTQMFNCFIKAQSVSTPKATQKSIAHFVHANAPKSQTNVDINSHHKSTTSTSTFSPTQFVESIANKGLSTIMETSEPVTGGTISTKSSVDTQTGSPEFDLEICRYTQNNHPGLKLPIDNIKHLETIKEANSIDSKPLEETTENITENIILNHLTASINKCKIADQNLERVEVKQKSPKLNNRKIYLPETPVSNLQLEPFMMATNFETPTTRKLGDVSRLEQPEGTVAKIKPIQFFEDKTETVPKVLLAKRPYDEGTPYHIGFNYSKDDQESSSIERIKPLKLFDNNAETLPSVVLPKLTPELPMEKFVIFEDQTETVPKIKIGVSTSCKAKSDDEEEEMFKLFSQTPPNCGNKMKTNPVSSKKAIDKSNNFSNLNDLSLSKPKFELDASAFFDSDEYSAPKAKIKCNYNSPDLRSKVSFMKSKVAETTNSNKCTSNLSFMPSFMQESFNFNEQPAGVPFKAKSNLSFMANFDESKRQSPVKGVSNVLNFFDNNSVRKSEVSLTNFKLPEVVMNCLQGPQKPEEKHKLSFSIFEESLKPVDSQKKDELVVCDNTYNSEKCEKSPGLNVCNSPKIIFERQSKFSIFEESSASNKFDLKKDEPKTSGCFDVSVKPEDFFEENIRTEAFAPNLSSIQNSTWLPAYNRQIKEPSFHIKEEVIDNENSAKSEQSSSSTKMPSILQKFSEITLCSDTASEFKMPFSSGNRLKYNNSSQFMSEFASSSSQFKGGNVIQPNEMSSLNKYKNNLKNDAESSDDENDLGRSIYFQHTPKTPLIHKNSWNEDDDNQSFNKQFEHPMIDLDHTQQIIDEMLFDQNFIPFNTDLNNAFLDKIEFTQYIDKLPTCEMNHKIRPLKKNGCMLDINDSRFNVLKLVAEGAYGSIFLGKELKTGKLYALKQERPANLWEYYICLELQSRLQNNDILHAFMNIEYALIGNNASILVSDFSNYGSLITVCNKIKSITMKSLDEYVVMHLTSQLLSIIDHLHASKIIHADIKADNILLMKRLSFNRNEYSLQLIDFGVSIDMVQYPDGQNFTFIHSANDFKCIEMLEKRPWSYQLDLFGLAGVIHVLLFSKYMDVEKTLTGWKHKSRMPRYFHKTVWDTIFSTLLNIRDLNSMPNLQNLRRLVEEEMAVKEKYVKDKLHDFNMAIDQ